jgi:hypothetical protein
LPGDLPDEHHVARGVIDHELCNWRQSAGPRRGEIADRYQRHATVAGNAQNFLFRAPLGHHDLRTPAMRSEPLLYFGANFEMRVVRCLGRVVLNLRAPVSWIRLLTGGMIRVNGRR